jgi:beta-glucosidase
MIARFAALAIAAGVAAGAAPRSATPSQPEIGARARPVLTLAGLRFHDLNGDGTLQPYEDWRNPVERRVDDLLGRMTAEEKVGLMLHGTPPTIGNEFRGRWDIARMRPLIANLQVRFFIHRMSTDVGEMADLANQAQAVAEGTRLGIPLTFSSDSRNTIREVQGVSVAPAQFSRWPEALGLAAIGDVALVRRLAAIAAQEYRAIGIRMALSPQADLATEPRWFRGNATFGDDPAKVSAYVEAYVEGFQAGSTGLHRGSVATVVKHWAGYGAQPDGLDAHNPYGQTIRLSNAAFADHLRAFNGALRARVSGVMPTYARPEPGLTIGGRPAEPVGAGFSRQMLHDLLRRDRGFDGMIVTDWKVTDDCPAECRTGTFDVDKIGMPWGVEGLGKSDRFAKAINAGVDQFGGVMDADVLRGMVRDGRLSQTRLDESARRILRQTFALGLFENAYVDPAAARALVGAPASTTVALDAQRRSFVLLENRGGLLPLKATTGRKVWLWKVDRTLVEARGLTVVERPEDADLAILRIAAPFTSRPAYFFGSSAHEGPLSYPSDNADRQAVERAAAAGVPTIVDVYLDRPAILTDIRPHATALLGNFGVTDAALLDVIAGRGKPEGRLPVELPSSDAAVERQRPDLAADIYRPLYRRGYGKTW